MPNKIGIKIWDSKEQNEYTKKWIKKYHLNYLTKWQKKFGLPGNFVLKAKEKLKNKTLAIVEFYPKNTYIITLTKETLQNRNKRDGWKNSIIHELLHVLFHLYYNKDSRKFTVDSEDDVIEILSELLTERKI